VNLRSPLDSISIFKVTTRERWDLATPLALLGLGLIGVTFIYSAQLSNTALHNVWLMQLIWLSLGAGVYVMVSLIDYRFWLSVSHWFFVGLRGI
jgi:rod shape determining protein RodA